MPVQSDIAGILVALGIGLLAGVDRELRKGVGPSRRAAGVRTFVVTALVGAGARLVGNPIVLGVAIASVAGLSAASYLRTRNRHPGLTTEAALIATALFGALAIDRPMLAAALGVIMSVTLAARSPLHTFIRRGLTRNEMSDGLVYAALTFVIWPLLPDRPLGPYHAVNPHALWLVVILAMSVGALGHVAMRLVGARLGLAISGFVSGFVSSAVTIGAMGARARQTPAVLGAAAGGAVLSTVATIIQLAVLVTAVSPQVARAMSNSLLLAAAAAVSFALLIVLRTAPAAPDASRPQGHAFNLQSILTFVAVLCVVLVAAAAGSLTFGSRGALAIAAVAGLVDLHAAAVSVAALAASGRESVTDATLAILVALSTNSVTKMVFALASGGPPFLLRVGPGLLLVAAAAWAGLFLPA